MSLKSTRPVKPSIGGPGPYIAPDPSMKKHKDDLDKITQDIQLMAHKIGEAKGEIPAATPPTTALAVGSATVDSPFVSGIRSLADNERKLRDVKDSKLSSLEVLLEKIAEYDRLMLAKTISTDATPKRRKSIGSDLLTLPTHLLLVDRLVDIFNQSKRVTVIRTNSSNNNVHSGSSDSEKPPLVPSPEVTELRSQVDTLRQHVDKLTEKLQLAEGKGRQSDSDVLQLRVQLLDSQNTVKSTAQELTSTQTELQTHIHNHAVEITSFQQQLKEQRQQSDLRIQELTLQLQQHQQQAIAAAAEIPEPTPTPVVDNQEELARLRAQLAASQEQCAQLDERLSCEVSINQAMRNALLAKAHAINFAGKYDDWDSDSPPPMNDKPFALDVPEEFRSAFQTLDLAVDQRLLAMRKEISLLLSLKHTLEGELSSSTLQRDMLQQDLQTLNETHSALTGAYHSLSLETALTSQRTGETEKLKAMILKLEEDAQNDRLERHSLEMRLRSSEIECKAKLSELQASERLVSSLQRKLRELGEGKNSDTKEYLDTFEEVLREEMSAMKGAFESKLRQAREDADAMSRKHQVEISKLQSNASLKSLGLAKL